MTAAWWRGLVVAVSLAAAACGGGSSRSSTGHEDVASREPDPSSGDEALRAPDATETASASTPPASNDAAPPGPRVVDIPGSHDLASVRRVEIALLDMGLFVLDARDVVVTAPDRLAFRVPWQMAGLATAYFADGTSVDIPIRPLGHVRRYCEPFDYLFRDVPASMERLGYGRPEVTIQDDASVENAEDEDVVMVPMTFVASRETGALRVDVVPNGPGMDIRAHLEPWSAEEPDAIASFFEDLESHAQLSLCGADPSM